MPVVAARELDDPVAPGKGAREPQGAHRRLGTRADEADHLDGGNGVDDLGGELDLSLGRRTEGRPAVGSRMDGLERLGIGVTEDQRSPGLHPVHVRRARDVLDHGAVPAGHEHGLVEPHRAHRAHRRVDATRDQLRGRAPELRASP